MARAPRRIDRPPLRPWTADELAMLGTMPDDQLARKIGRDVTAVRSKRIRAEIETARPVGKPPAPAKTKLGALIREARRGRPVAELAAAAGLSERYWHHLERAGKSVPVDTAKRIAESLGVDPAQLLGLQ